MKKLYIQPASKMLNVYTKDILNQPIGSFPASDEEIDDDGPNLINNKKFDPWE